MKKKRKTRVVRFLVTAQERSRIEKRAKGCGLTLSEFIRRECDLAASEPTRSDVAKRDERFYSVAREEAEADGQFDGNDNWIPW